MTPIEVIEIAREAIFVLLKIGVPIMMIALIVGLAVSLFQALTQIQEQTVAFVPKIIVMLLVLSVSLPWLIARMLQYTTNLIDGIPGRF